MIQHPDQRGKKSLSHGLLLVSNKSALIREPRTFFWQDQEAVQNLAESLAKHGPPQPSSPEMTLGSLLGRFELSFYRWIVSLSNEIGSRQHHPSSFIIGHNSGTRLDTP